MKKIENILDNIACHIYKKIEKQEISFDLYGGLAGVSLFLFYYSRHATNECYEEKAVELLLKSIDNIHLKFNHTFCGGVSGLCWCVQHLVINHFIEKENINILNKFDEYLCNSVRKELNMNNYDFLHGAIGTANYLLNRSHKEIAKDIEYELIEILHKTKKEDSESCYWEYIVGEKSNISLSHGLAGTIIFLCKAYKSGVNHLQIHELLKKSIKYLLEQEIKINNKGSLFPTFSKATDNQRFSGYVYSRLAWCYGDLGVGLAIWHYAKLIDDKQLENKAIEIFTHSAKRRNLIENNVNSAEICHGTAGLALIFKRMYLNTQIKDFNDTAEYWLEQTLLMIERKRNKFMGFKSDFPFQPLGLLEGLAGIGLVLLFFLGEKDTHWDECLLLS